MPINESALSMRVLFVDQFSDLGGAQLMLRDILAEALRRGWHTEFMAPGNGAIFDFCEAHAIPSHRLSLGTYTNGRKKFREILRYGWDMARAAKGIRAAILRSRIDLVVTNGPRILVAAAGVPCPVVFHLHSRVDKGYARRIMQWALGRSGASVICCSKFVATPLLPFLRPGALRIIYNGVRDCGFKDDRVRHAGFRVGIIGRIAPEKGHLDFIQAAEIVARSTSKIRFTVHGARLFSELSFERHLRSMAKGRPIEFHGWTDDVAGVLREIDILVVPSTAVEATPRVIVEAFSAGTPVIAYPSGGIPELIRHGDTGLLTAAPDPGSLAESIQSLLSDPALMTRLARNARLEWEGRFRVEDFQREVCDLLECSVKERGKTQSAPAVACENDIV
jgi:glycosyltransferase involved in cell wall biosynthesis